MEVFDILHGLTNSDAKKTILPDSVVCLLTEKHDEPEAPLFGFIETKDYLNCTEGERKRSGWRAIKSVVTWRDRLFEIQLQPLGNYYLELDHMSGPSHRSFKLRRDSIRNKISDMVPLYGFYQELLKSLFLGGPSSFDKGKISVVVK